MDIPAAGNVRRQCPALCAPRIRAGAVVRWPFLSAETAPIHERDIAAVVVRAVCETGHAGAEYVLTGPESIEEISPDEARRELTTLTPAPVVNMLLDAAIGQPAFVTS
jgi:uncharacterized protein YbjT (DUF2867 family)